MSEPEHAMPTLWEQQTAIARAGAPYLIGYVVLVTAMYSLVDVFLPEQDSAFIASSIAGWVAGYILLAYLMIVSARDEERMPGGIADYFGLGILTYIPILIGLVLFVLPGLYLLMRWTPAYARAYATDDGVTAAMRWSWKATAPIQMQLSLALLGPMVCFALLTGLGVGLEDAWYEASALAYNLGVVGFNLFLSISVAWTQLVGVAAYRLIESQPTASMD